MNLIRREFNTKLLLPTTLIIRLVYVVDVVTNNMGGSSLLGWDDRLVNMIISITYRSIMTMSSQPFWPSFFNQALGTWIIIYKEITNSN